MEKEKRIQNSGSCSSLITITPGSALVGTAEAVSGTTGGAGETFEAEGTGAYYETARSSESERGNLGGFLKMGLSIEAPTLFKAAFHPSVHARSRIPGNCPL